MPDETRSPVDPSEGHTCVVNEHIQPLILHRRHPIGLFSNIQLGRLCFAASITNLVSNLFRCVNIDVADDYRGSFLSQQDRRSSADAGPSSFSGAW
jgi:hypothetical protein